MLVCDIARAPLLAAIPLLHALGLLPFPALLALVAASGVFLAPYMGVQRAVVPELVGEEQADVAHATAFFQAANRLTIFLGPPAAGVLIASSAPRTSSTSTPRRTSSSFALVARVRRTRPRSAAPAEQRGVLAGVRFLLRDRLLRVWTPAFTLLDIVLAAALRVAAGARRRRTYDANPHILGWLFGALGGGALVGAFVVDAHRAPRRAARRSARRRSSARCARCGCSRSRRRGCVAVAGMASGGFFMSLVNAPMQALVMLRIPRELRTQALARVRRLPVHRRRRSGSCSPAAALARYDTRSVLVVVLVAADALRSLVFVADRARRAVVAARGARRLARVNRLEGKHVVVTGAGTGIGRAIAERLAARRRAADAARARRVAPARRRARARRRAPCDIRDRDAGRSPRSTGRSTRSSRTQASAARTSRATATASTTSSRRTSSAPTGAAAPPSRTCRTAAASSSPRRSSRASACRATRRTARRRRGCSGSCARSPRSSRRAASR